MINIRLKLISGECKVTSGLSRVLGQYQINTSKFCTKFNKESSDKFQNGILFYIKLEKVTKDLYNISYGSPCLKFLLMQFIQNKGNLRIIKIEQLFDLFIIYNKLNLEKEINLKNFFGSLSTFAHLKIDESFFNSK